MNEDNLDVLVVDDEKRIADTLTLILRSKGYRADCAYDGAAAYTLCIGRPPRLVISDVVMPVMSGVELAIKLRDEVPRCPVLLFSGQAASADMLQDAKLRGYVFEMLAKPVHPDQLLHKIEQMIGTGDSR